MIRYEDGERDILLNKLIQLLDMETGCFRDPSTTPYTFVRVENYHVQISIDLLIKIVLFNETQSMDLINSLSRTYVKLFEFIHFVPLLSVPLYIHVFPDVAKWRLEIGK